MATKRDRKLPSEYRGPERAFQFDRDTFLIYTGIHEADMRPFSRIGAGTSVPAGLLPQIENVVVPEENIWNVGLETAWLKESLAAGTGHIRYVGSKERTTQLHRYLDPGEDDMSRSREDAPPDPVEYAAYQAPERGVSQKDRCTITYMATGEYQVTVGGSRVLDSQSLSRGRMGLDKEYEQIKKILNKQDRRCEHGWSFYPLHTEGSHLSVYWGLQGKGLGLNPPADIHYHGLTHAIDTERMQMVIAENAELPGLAELFRRSNLEERQIGAYCPEMERIIHLKRLYNRAQVKTFDDSRTLPFSKETTFFVSRSKSHGVFALKANSDSEFPMQVIFPLKQGAKQSRSFDFTKGPFDLELMILQEDQKLESAGSQLTLIARGMASARKFEKSKLQEGVFPLMAECEYRLQQMVQLSSLADEVSLGLKGTEFEQTVPELFTIMGQTGPNIDEETVLDLLYRIRTQARPESIITRINLGEATRAINSYLSMLQDKYPRVAKLSDKVARRYSTRSLRVRDLEALSGSLAFEIYAIQGRVTILQARAVQPPRISIVFPPEIDEVKSSQKEYRKYLKEQNRILDKGDESPSDRATLEFLEKLLEERLHLAEERERLGDLLEDLDLSVPVEDKGDLPFHMKLPYWLRRTVEFLRIPDFVEWVKGKFGGGEREKGSLDARLSAWFLLPLAALVLGALGFAALSGSGDDGNADNGNMVSRVLGWFSSDDSSPGGGEDTVLLSETSEDGEANPSGQELSIAPPGQIQENGRVPGEENVEASEREVFQFSDLLARRNGFAPLRQQNPDLRNPDLVFPGDRLNLPDGRILRITPGEYIWEVARKQYRKDMARLTLLDQQIRALGMEYEKKKMLMS